MSTAATAAEPSPIEPLLTKKQGADIYGVSVRTLEKMIAAGELPVVRVYRAVRIAPADLRAAIEAARITKAGGSDA